MENNELQNERFLENMRYLINDFIMISRDFELFESGVVNSSGTEVKVLHKHSPSKFPKVFEILLKSKIEEYPEELISELEKLIEELRKIEKEIRKSNLNEKGKILCFIHTQIISKQNELGYILPEKFKEIFLKALQLDKIEYIPKGIIDEASEAISRIMQLPKTPS